MHHVTDQGFSVFSRHGQICDGVCGCVSTATVRDSCIVGDGVECVCVLCGVYGTPCVCPCAAVVCVPCVCRVCFDSSYLHVTQRANISHLITDQSPYSRFLQYYVLHSSWWSDNGQRTSWILNSSDLSFAVLLYFDQFNL